MCFSADMKKLALLQRESAGASESLPSLAIKCQPPNNTRFPVYQPAHRQHTLLFARNRGRFAIPHQPPDHRSVCRCRAFGGLEHRALRRNARRILRTKQPRDCGRTLKSRRSSAGSKSDRVGGPRSVTRRRSVHLTTSIRTLRGDMFSQAPIPSSTAASAVVVSHPRSKAAQNALFTAPLIVSASMNENPPRCAQQPWSAVPGRVQYNDRDTVPIVVSDSGWRPVLQRNRPNGT